MKFDLSNIPKLFHNGQEVKGIYLNGVLAWESDSGGGGGSEEEEVIYENVAWTDVATGDEVILVFENSTDLTYWVMTNEMASNGPCIKSIRIVGDLENRATIHHPTDDNTLVFTVNVFGSSQYQFQKKDGMEYLHSRSSSNNFLSVSDSFGSTTQTMWNYDGTYLQNAFNNRYLYAYTSGGYAVLSKNLTTTAMNGGKVYIFKRVITA